MTDKQKLEKILLRPSDIITFKGALDTNLETFLSIFNPNNVVITFKIKPSKYVTATPHYGYVRPQTELFIKLKAKKMKRQSRKDRLTISLAHVIKSMPRDAKKFWKGEHKPKQTDRRVIYIHHSLPGEGDEEKVEKKSDSEKSQSKKPGRKSPESDGSDDEPESEEKKKSVKSKKSKKKIAQSESKKKNVESESEKKRDKSKSKKKDKSESKQKVEFESKTKKAESESEKKKDESESKKKIKSESEKEKPEDEDEEETEDSE